MGKNRIKFTINIIVALKKCIFWRFEGHMVDQGMIRYECFRIICFNCGIIGHQKPSCTTLLNLPSEDGLTFGDWIKGRL